MRDWVVNAKLTPPVWNQQFAIAFDLMRTNPMELEAITSAFEPLLNDVFFHKDAIRVAEIRQRSREMFGQFLQGNSNVPLEVRHLCWHLQNLGIPKFRFATSSVIDVLVSVRFGMLGYKYHPRAACKLCVAYPDDEWLSIRDSR